MRLKDNRPETSQAGTSIKPSQIEMQSLSASIEDIFSPIQWIPPDVLQEIFLYCLPVHPTIQSASPVISSLSRVSPTWRAVVLLSPRLWSRLFVTVQYEDDLDHCTQMVTRWFQHARSVPLSFFLNIDFEAFDDDIARMRSFLVGLSSLMLRVQHFGLHARFTTDLLCSFVDLKWELPLLKKLYLFSHADLDQNEAVEFSVPLFQAAPNLVQVAIQNTITNAHDVQHILPWSQLTRTTIAYSIPISRWIEVMQMCPMMLNCEVFFDKHYEVGSTPLDSYSPNGVHHSLEHLYLDILEGGPPFLKLLSIYNLPSLQTLYLFYHSQPIHNFPPPQGISALANLREFSFYAERQKISPEHFTHMAEVLCEMVNLEILEFQQPTQDFVPLYEAVSLKQSEKPAILPRLSTFKLWIPTRSVVEKDVEFRPLFEMLSSRCEKDTIPVGYKPLREFIVGVESEDSYERMKTIFGPWIGGLPPQLRVSINLSPSDISSQPDGWTHPISE